MGAPEILSLLRQSGLEVTADKGQLIVRPAERLSDDLRQLIRGHKQSILAMLWAATGNTAHSCWVIQFAGDRYIVAYRHPAATRSEEMAHYADCVDLEPLPEPEPYPDDRRTCVLCANLARSGLCLAAQRGEIAANRKYEPIRDFLRRCEGYSPKTDERLGRR